MSVDQTSVLLGVDGSPADELALAWAVQEAGARATSLRVVCAHHWLLTSGPLPSDEPGTARLHSRQLAEQIIATTLERARAIDPAVPMTGEAIEGEAVEVLIEESKRMALMVLGSRQLGAFGSSFLGSVSAAVAARADGPVVVVRGPSGLPGENPGVVVGVDGGEASAALLEFGFEFASRHGIPLRAVLCVHRDLLTSMSWRSGAPAPERAEVWLAEALAGWQEKFPDVAVHSAVIRDHPAAGLVTESLNQNLLVVGSHGHHALAGTLLGSVSQGVLHHAYCPVAVVPTASN
jgi:nucleotide-binding universal stress UspA family protein